MSPSIWGKFASGLVAWSSWTHQKCGRFNPSKILDESPAVFSLSLCFWWELRLFVLQVHSHRLSRHVSRAVVTGGGAAAAVTAVARSMWTT